MGLPGGRAGSRPVPGGWGMYATLVAFGVAVCLTGYLALGELDDSANLSHALNSIPAFGAASSPAQSRPPLPSLAVDDAVHAESAHSADAPPDEQPALAPTVADKRPAPKAPEESQPLPGFDPSYAIREPMAPPPVAAVAAVPQAVVATPEPVVPDRWQLLASAMSRCERENMIAGLLCKERARLQYCEGYWGTAPQCPAVGSANTR